MANFFGNNSSADSSVDNIGGNWGGGLSRQPISTQTMMRAFEAVQKKRDPVQEYMDNANPEYIKSKDTYDAMGRALAFRNAQQSRINRQYQLATSGADGSVPLRDDPQSLVQRAQIGAIGADLTGGARAGGAQLAQQLSAADLQLRREGQRATGQRLQTLADILSQQEQITSDELSAAQQELKMAQDEQQMLLAVREAKRKAAEAGEGSDLWDYLTSAVEGFGAGLLASGGNPIGGLIGAGGGVALEAYDSYETTSAGDRAQRQLNGVAAGSQQSSALPWTPFGGSGY